MAAIVAGRMSRRATGTHISPVNATIPASSPTTGVKLMLSPTHISVVSSVAVTTGFRSRSPDVRASTATMPASTTHMLPKKIGESTTPVTRLYPYRVRWSGNITLFIPTFCSRCW